MAVYIRSAVRLSLLACGLLAFGGCRLVAGYGSVEPGGPGTDGARPMVDGARHDGDHDGADQDADGSVPDGLADAGPRDGLNSGRDETILPTNDMIADVATVDAGPALDLAKADLAKADLAKADLAKADTAVPPPSGWYSVDKIPCTSFCSGLGKANVASVEGAKCASGEVRPQSAIDAGVVFKYGCGAASCTTATPAAGATIGPTQFCYATGQFKDGQTTDWTVGCFCK